MTATLGASGGSAGESDTIDSTNENLLGGKGNDTLAGDAGPNRIDGYSGAGNDTLDGAGGADTLIGRDGNDTLRSRDGVADADDCGDGIDSAQVDALDTVTACETVDAPVVAQGGGGQPQGQPQGQPHEQPQGQPGKKAGPKVSIAKAGHAQGQRDLRHDHVPPQRRRHVRRDGRAAVGQDPDRQREVRHQGGQAQPRQGQALAAARGVKARAAAKGHKLVATASVHDRSSATATTKRAITVRGSAHR